VREVITVRVAGERRHLQTLAIVAVVATLGLALVSGCGRSEPEGAADGSTATDKPSAATQTSEGGEVTIAVTWRDPTAGPVFEVAMDTHSVNLDDYDLQNLAVLHNDQGKEVRPSSWDAPKGGHHREGTLRFPEKTPDGGLMIGPDTREIELVIRDVAGVPERRFVWRL
jgi:hypothetical protein